MINSAPAPALACRAQSRRRRPLRLLESISYPAVSWRKFKLLAWQYQSQREDRPGGLPISPPRPASVIAKAGRRRENADKDPNFERERDRCPLCQALAASADLLSLSAETRVPSCEPSHLFAGRERLPRLSGLRERRQSSNRDRRAVGKLGFLRPPTVRIR